MGNIFLVIPVSDKFNKYMGISNLPKKFNINSTDLENMDISFETSIRRENPSSIWPKFSSASSINLIASNILWGYTPIDFTI